MLASSFCYIQSWWWVLLPYSIITLVIYILGTILVETKAGKVRERVKKMTADGKTSNYSATAREWLLLDMTQPDYPVYRSEYLYWDWSILTRWRDSDEWQGSFYSATFVWLQIRRRNFNTRISQNGQKVDYDKAQYQLFPFGYERCEDKVLCDINLGCQRWMKNWAIASSFILRLWISIINIF